MNEILLRQKLKTLDLSLVDMAHFLNISRPTLYKLIESYELGHRNKIDSKICNIFDFIIHTPNLCKTKAISYIIESFSKPQIQSAKERKEAIAHWLKKEDSMKVDFIYMLGNSEVFDPILPYMLECGKILAKKNIGEKEREMLKILSDFYLALGLKLHTKLNTKGKK